MPVANRRMNRMSVNGIILAHLPTTDSGHSLGYLEGLCVQKPPLATREISRRLTKSKSVVEDLGERLGYLLSTVRHQT